MAILVLIFFITKDIKVVHNVTTIMYMYIFSIYPSFMSLRNKPCETYISNEYFPHNLKNLFLIIGVLYKTYDKDTTKHTNNSAHRALSIALVFLHIERPK